MADVNVLVNIVNSHAVLIVDTPGNNEYRRSVDVSNCRLMGRRLERDNNPKLGESTFLPHSFQFIADNHICIQRCVV
jgi:hypothetical protein